MKLSTRNSLFITLVAASGLVNADLIDNGNGTITDTDTGLMWYQDANFYPQTYLPVITETVGNLVYASHDDWRLPTIAEFDALYAELTKSGSFDPAPFINMDLDGYTDWYWSSDTSANGDAHYFKFDTGTSVATPWMMLLGTLPVRNSSGYTVTVIGPTSEYDLRRQRFNLARSVDVNNEGTVAVTDSSNHYLWSSADGVQLLSTTGEPALSALNDNGVVVGGSARWTVTASGETYYDLGDIFGPLTYAHDVNQAGTIVGWSGSQLSFHEFDFTAVKWDAQGNATALQTPSNHTTQALAISDNDIIVGLKGGVSISDDSIAVLWDSNGNIVELGTTGGDYSYAQDIDRTGTYVVGTSAALPQVCIQWGCWYPSHPFIWDENNGMVSLGDLTEANEGNAVARGVNSSGVVVGDSTLGLYNYETHGFVWKNGVMSDLNDLVPADPNWTITSAMAINDAGQIVAVQEATDGSNNNRAVLLTP